MTDDTIDGKVSLAIPFITFIFYLFGFCEPLHYSLQAWSLNEKEATTSVWVISFQFDRKSPLQHRKGKQMTQTTHQT